MTQLQDLKSYMITKLDGRFRELFTELSKTIRVKRKAIEGRKTALDRYYLQVSIYLDSHSFTDFFNKYLLIS